MVELRESKYAGVFTDNRDFFTPAFGRGANVYGEKLVSHSGRQFRRWDPHRSKLAALMQKECPVWPFTRKTEVLYLGAAGGTTASHISDLCVEGRLYCIEISPTVFRKLLDVSSTRPNMLPFLGDADKPETYRHLITSFDVLYQDIAQRDQVSIFIKNLGSLRPGGIGFLMLKARSVDVSEEPEELYRESARELSIQGFKVLASKPLDPFEKDHAAIVVQRPSGQA